MKTCFNTIRLLAFLVLLISCKKESILEREASLSDKELLEKGQLIYFRGRHDNGYGLCSGKLLSNDTVKITTLYDYGDYGEEVFASYVTSPLEVNTAINTVYWVAQWRIYKASLTPSANSVERIGVGSDFYSYSAIDKLNNKMYLFGNGVLNSLDVNSHEIQSVKVQSDLIDSFAFLGGVEYFDGDLYLLYAYYYPYNNDYTKIVKFNVASGSAEVLYESEKDGLINPGGLAIDKTNKKLYVIDRDGLTSKAIIREGNLNGEGKMTKVFDIGNFEGNIEYANNLKFDQKNGYFFWYDDDKRSIGRIKKGESSPKYWFMEYGNSDFTVPEIDN